MLRKLRFQMIDDKNNAKMDTFDDLKLVSGPDPLRVGNRHVLSLDVQVNWRNIQADSPRTHQQVCRLWLEKNPDRPGWKVANVGSPNGVEKTVCNYTDVQ